MYVKMEGYVYCLSNPCYIGLVKVGEIHTEGKTPLDRAKELFTTGVPEPFKVEFAKKVKDPKQKEGILHQLLEQYTERHSNRREFFRVSVAQVRLFFDLMDGEEWTDTPPTQPVIVTQEERRGCRDTSKCFMNGQKIRHTIGNDKVWIGIYDATRDKIIYEGKEYSLNKFASTHYLVERPDRSSEVNAWRECECDMNGNWLSTYCLAPYQSKDTNS